MALGGTGEHGQVAAKVVLAVKRFVLENVIIQLQNMTETYVLELNKAIVRATSSPAQVTKAICLLI